MIIRKLIIQLLAWFGALHTSNAEPMVVYHAFSKYASLTNVDIPSTQSLTNSRGNAIQSLDVAFMQLFILGEKISVSPKIEETFKKILLPDQPSPAAPKDPSKSPVGLEIPSKYLIVSLGKATFLVKIQHGRVILLELNKPVHELNMYIYARNLKPKFVEDVNVVTIIEGVLQSK